MALLQLSTRRWPIGWQSHFVPFTSSVCTKTPFMMHGVRLRSFLHQRERWQERPARPIGLTAVASKLFERVIVQTKHYMTSNELSTDRLHWFNPCHSAVTNLLQCNTAVSQHPNSINFSRAFDKVSPSIWSTKLLALGVCDKLHTGLVHFLAGRT